MTEDPYRLSPEEREQAVARIAKNEGFVPRIYFDTHNPPIPTIGYGQSLTDLNRTPWGNLPDRLASMGVNAPGVEDRLTRAIYAGGIEGWRPNGDYRNPPPLGIVVDKDKAKAPVYAAVDRGADEIRNSLGQDAAGAYNWDKLSADQHAALLDAQYNSPSYIGENLVKALQHQDDPDWQEKARYELGVNILQPSRRTWENAGAFRQIQDTNPPPNLFNTEAFEADVAGRNLLNSDTLSQNLLNSAEENLHKAGY